jgi:hypothetical protein
VPDGTKLAQAGIRRFFPALSYRLYCGFYCSFCSDFADLAEAFKSSSGIPSFEAAIRRVPVGTLIAYPLCLLDRNTLRNFQDI